MGLIRRAWAGRSVLVTGHTGFKGAWLTTWLALSGARVTGLSLPPERHSLWRLIEPLVDVVDLRGDIRDPAAVESAMELSRPEFVFHLAAQSLVRVGYQRPVETIDVNVRGTAVVLEAVRTCPSVQAVLVVTSDKVYDTVRNQQPYTESSILGGTDPYAASKACTELVVNAYRDSYFRTRGVPIATVRAGNVIGGGDWADHRLVPDAVRMLRAGRPLRLRYPEATRPWQHVLDPLYGYLVFADQMIRSPDGVPEAVNFGPPTVNCIRVSEVVERLTELWDGAPGWTKDESAAPPEASALTLCSDLAETTLGWRPVLDLDEALSWTAEWYHYYLKRGSALDITHDQIRQFESRIGGS